MKSMYRRLERVRARRTRIFVKRNDPRPYLEILASKIGL